MAKLLCGLVLSLFASWASAIVIDFEDIAVAAGVNSIGGDRISRGFSFDSSANHTHLSNDTFSGNSGSTFLVTDDFLGANTTTVARVGGGVFSLASVDLGEWNDGIALASTITVTGNLAGGGSIVTSFTLDGVLSAGGSNNFETFLFGPGWTGLTSVVFDATAGAGEMYWAMDNLVAGVPEPGALLLVASGLAALGWRRRARPGAPRLG